MTRNFYLTLPTPNGLKRLFKFEKGGDGSVYVFSSSKPRIGTAKSIHELINLNDADFSSPVQTSKISLHSTRGRPNLNRINFREDEEPQFTQAVKIEKRFSPVIVRIFGDLKAEKHDILKPTLDDMQLPLIDTSKDTLVLGIAIVPSDVEFEQIEDHPSNLLKITCNDFNVWVIYSLFNFPALKASIDIKLLGGSLENPIGGLENFEIYNFYTFAKSMYTDAYFESFPERNSF